MNVEYNWRNILYDELIWFLLNIEIYVYFLRVLNLVICFKVNKLGVIGWYM